LDVFRAALARDPNPDELRREANECFAAAVVAGLSQRQKQLSPKYFYGSRGPSIAMKFTIPSKPINIRRALTIQNFKQYSASQC
jgi:FixJ family two-component response regulator